MLHGTDSCHDSKEEAAEPSRAKLDFRLAQEEEIPVVVEIIRFAFGQAAAAAGITEEVAPRFAAFTTLESLREFRERTGARLYLLFADGVPVACGGWSPYRDVPNTGWLNRIAVLPEHQGKGFGALVVRLLEDELRRNGYLRVRLSHLASDARLHAFYLRLGYRKIATRVPEGWSVEVWDMEKEL